MRLHKRLRTVQAISYAPSVFYDHLNADTAHLVLYADSDRERRAELAKVFGEVFEELGEVEESEVEAAQRNVREHWTGDLAPPPTEIMVLEAQRAAMDWIFEKEFESMEAIEAELSTVTADDVSAFSSEMKATTMFALPGEALLGPRFGKRALISTNPAVRGRVTQSVDAPIHRQRLVHGPDGVSVLYPDGVNLRT